MDGESTTSLLTSRTSLAEQDVASSHGHSVFVMNGEDIYVEREPSRTVYQLSHALRDVSRTGTFITLSRVEVNEASSREASADAAEGGSTEEPRTRQLFSLVHPLNAGYRRDLPAYYITSATSQGVGNMILDTSKHLLQKLEFTALLHAGRTSSHSPLFDEGGGGQRALFKAKKKPGLGGDGGYRWTDSSDGRRVADESGSKGDERRKLVMLAGLEENKVDALVAVWVLRMWHEMAESREAKRDALDRLTPAESVYGGSGKMGKRMGALGSLAGAG